MVNSEIALALAKYPLGILCSAHPAVRAMYTAIVPLFAGAKMSGPANTVRIPPGQNAGIHRAVHTAKQGDILVVDSGGDTAFGAFGDILASCCQNRGIHGLVIDGAVRDAAEIRALHFPVFCLGANAAAADKADPGEIGVEIVCGLASVRPGDFVVGDDDGVVIVPRESAEEVIEKAEAVVRREASVKARIAAGETTCEILGIHV